MNTITKGMKLVNRPEQVYKLKYEVGLSIPEIARLSGIAESTVRRHIRRHKSRIGKTTPLPIKMLPKILIIDIETLPMEIFVWALYKQKPTYDQVIKDWCILSYSAKWLYDNEIYTGIITPEEAVNREDKSIIKGLWNLVDQADIIIAHNAIRFDLRKINARFMLNGLEPPSPYQVIDTLKHAQKVAAFSSHKLNDLLLMLGKSAKIKTEYSLWKKCAGNGTCSLKEQTNALKEMLTYNINDVYILEELYLILRAWIKPHPNIGLFDTTTVSVCPNCGSPDIIKKGYYYTSVGRYETFRCNNCKSIGRSRHNDLDKNQKKNLLTSIAR